jgi:hypothetical protein
VGVTAVRTSSAEKVSSLGEEPATDGVDVFVAKVSEFLELGFLGGVQVGWDFDGNAHVEIAMPISLDVLHAFAFKPENGSVLGAGRDLDSGLSFEGGNIDLRAQGGLNKTDRNIANQVVSVALEDLMSLNVEDDIEIACGTTASACFAVAGGTKTSTGIHAGWNADFDFGGALALTGSLASAAGVLDDATCALATGTGLGNAENAAGADHLAATTTGGAGFNLGFGRAAGTMANIALIELADGDLFLGAVGGLLERKLHIVSKIASALGSGGVGTAGTSEQFVEDGAGATAESLAEDLERIVKTAGALPAHAGIKGGMAVLIVGLALVRVAQRLVSFPDLFKRFFCRFIPGILVWMEFERELAVGLFDLLIGSGPFHAKNFVIITFGHSQATGFLATTTPAGRSKRSRNL